MPPVNGDLNTVLRYFCLATVFIGLTVKYHYHKKEIYEKEQLTLWMNKNGLDEYKDLFLEHGRKKSIKSCSCGGDFLLHLFTNRYFIPCLRELFK